MDMKGKMIFLLYVTIFSINLSANYEALKAYKADIKNQPIFKSSTTTQADTQLYIVNFKDINKMDTELLESQYRLKLHKCIADGICIFKLDTNQTQYKELDFIIENESNINSIIEYLPYEFKAY